MSAATVTRTERGYAGHFIGCAKCSFRRNTLLELGEVRVVVSTVGSYRAGKDGEVIPVSAAWNRYYETMAFRAAPAGGPYVEATGDGIKVAATCAINECEFDSDFAADLMHEAVVAEIAARMEAGETF